MAMPMVLRIPPPLVNYVSKFEDGIPLPSSLSLNFPGKDLVVDRSAFDRIIQAGGYIMNPYR